MVNRSAAMFSLGMAALRLTMAPTRYCISQITRRPAVGQVERSDTCRSTRSNDERQVSSFDLPYGLATPVGHGRRIREPRPYGSCRCTSIPLISGAFAAVTVPALATSSTVKAPVTRMSLNSRITATFFPPPAR